MKKLKIDNARVLDVHYPDNHVVALLIHNDYANNLVALFDKAGVKPIDDFDPLDARRLRNPLFANLDQQARQAKCTEIHQTRLLRSLAFIRESIRPAIARDFLRKTWITDDQYKSAIGKAQPASLPVDAATAQVDANMTDVIDTFYINPSASSNSLTGDGEPVEEL